MVRRILPLHEREIPPLEPREYARDTHRKHIQPSFYTKAHKLDQALQQAKDELERINSFNFRKVTERALTALNSLEKSGEPFIVAVRDTDGYIRELELQQEQLLRAILSEQQRRKNAEQNLSQTLSRLRSAETELTALSHQLDRYIQACGPLQPEAEHEQHPKSPNIEEDWEER